MTFATRLRACDDAPSKHQPIPCNQQGGLHRMVTVRSRSCDTRLVPCLDSTTPVTRPPGCATACTATSTLDTGEGYGLVRLARLRGFEVQKEAKPLISNECRCESLHYTVVANSAIFPPEINPLEPV